MLFKFVKQVGKTLTPKLYQVLLTKIFQPSTLITNITFHNKHIKEERIVLISMEPAQVWMDKFNTH